MSNYIQHKFMDVYLYPYNTPNKWSLYGIIAYLSILVQWRITWCTFYLVRSCAKNKCLFYGRRKLITTRSTEIKRFQFMVDGLLYQAVHFGGGIISIALTKSASLGRKSTTCLWWLRVYQICFGCAVSSSESQRLRPQRKYYVMNAIHFIERVTMS